MRLKNVTIQLSFCSFQGKSCEILELSVYNNDDTLKCWEFKADARMVTELCKYLTRLKQVLNQQHS